MADDRNATYRKFIETLILSNTTLSFLWNLFYILNSCEVLLARIFTHLWEHNVSSLIWPIPSVILITQPLLTLIADSIVEKRRQWPSRGTAFLTWLCTRSWPRTRCSLRQSSSACSPFRARALPQKRNQYSSKSKVISGNFDWLVIIWCIFREDILAIFGWSSRNIKIRIFVWNFPFLILEFFRNHFV